MTTLTFQNTTFSVINQQNQTYFTAREIGTALGYRNPLGDISKLYERNIDEFTPCMTQLVEMPTAGGVQRVRIFSLRGCHLIGMLSHTKVAKDFRKWVLDILDKETQTQAEPQQLALPAPMPMPEPTHTLTLTEQEIQHLVWVWFVALRCTSTLQDLYPMLEQLRSGYAPTVYSQAYEYRHTLQEAHEVLERITDGFRLDHRTNWRVLHHLRNFDPTFKTRSF